MIKRANKVICVQKGGVNMATATMRNSNSNIFELKVSNNKLADLLEKLEKPGLTKEYLEECKRTASLFKKSSK